MNGTYMGVTQLKIEAGDVGLREGTYELMRKSYSVGDFTRRNCDFTELVRLADRFYPTFFGVSIPESLITNANNLLVQGFSLGFGPFASPPRESRLNSNRDEYIQFLEGCKSIHEQLYRILMEHIHQQTQTEN